MLISVVIAKEAESVKMRYGADVFFVCAFSDDASALVAFEVPTGKFHRYHKIRQISDGNLTVAST